MSAADVSMLKFQLLLARQERDNGYQEMEMFKQFYKTTSQRAQQLMAEKDALIDENAALREEVRRLLEIESTLGIPSTLLQATLEEVSLERDQLEKENMSDDQLMEKLEKNEKEDLTLALQLYNTTGSEMEERLEVTERQRNELAERVKVAVRERNEMAERVEVAVRERNEKEQKALALEKELSAARQKLSETAHQLECMGEELANVMKTTRQLECKEREMSTLKEELAQVTRDYHVLRTENRQLCHRMQRRRWLDRRLRKHFQRRNPPAVKQAASIVRSQHERFQSLVRRRRAAMLMESLCFAFFVAKQQDAARARILYGTAVSDDDNGRCEVVEGGANPEGVAVAEEEEGGRVCCRSELVVVPSDVCRVLRHYLPVDVQREASERLQSPLPSSINLVCPSSVDHFSCWLGRPQHQGKCRQRMRVFRSINRRCSRCGQPLKKSLRPNQPHSTGCGRGVSGGGWPPAMAIFRGQVRRYMRGVV